MTLIGVIKARQLMSINETQRVGRRYKRREHEMGKGWDEKAMNCTSIKTKRNCGALIKYSILYITILLLMSKGFFATECMGAAMSPAPAHFVIDGELKTLYGYIGSFGVWGIPPLYEQVGSWPQPIEMTEKGYLYPAQASGKWGFLNGCGEWVIEPTYEFVQNFRSNRAYIVTLEGERHFINPDGKIIFSMTDMEIQTTFSDGIAILLDRKTKEWVFIDTDNRELFRMENIEECKSPYEFPYPQQTCSEGKIALKTKGKWGFIDANGKWVIQPQFEDVLSFSENMAAAKLHGKWGYINETGTWIIYPQFENVHQYSEGLAGVKLNNTWRFIDKNGRAAFPMEFVQEHVITNAADPYGRDEEAYTFHEGLACIYINQMACYINQAGKIEIKTPYLYGGPFVNGIAKVADGHWNGYIDFSGSVVIGIKDNVDRLMGK